MVAVRCCVTWLFLIMVPLLPARPTWTCTRGRKCEIDLRATSSTAADFIGFSLDEQCGTCLVSAYGACPWLTQTTRSTELVRCEDGTEVNDFSCVGGGHGQRILCPAFETMCADRSCGGHLDNCCDKRKVGLPCTDRGGIRLCNMWQLSGDLVQYLNNTHGPSNAGQHHVCRCTPSLIANKSRGTLLGHFEYVGPVAGQTVTCQQGVRCNVGVLAGFNMNYTRSLFQATLAESCKDIESHTPTQFVSGLRASWYSNLSSSYVFPSSDYNEMSPGIYLMCWCQTSDHIEYNIDYKINYNTADCSSLRDFNVEAGKLVLQGPFKIHSTLKATLGQDFAVKLNGISLSSADKVRLRPGPRCETHSETDSVTLQAHASGNSFQVKQQFNFGLLQEDLNAGKYKLCWCKPKLEDCIHASDFSVPVADVLMICPENRFAADGEGSCQACGFFRIPNDDRTACIDDIRGQVLFAAFCFSSVIAMVILFFQIETARWQGHGYLASGIQVVGRKLHIEDVSVQFDSKRRSHAAVTTVSAHKLRQCGGSYPITFHNTGHYMLDRKPSRKEGTFYRVQVTGPRTLELLDAKGEPIQTADASMGYCVLGIRHTFMLSEVMPHIPAVVAVILFSMLAVLIASQRQHGLVREHIYTIGATLFLGLFLSRILKWRRRRNSLSAKLKIYMQKVEHSNPHPVACEKGPSRAITAYQLFHMWGTFAEYIRQRNLYYIDANIVRPVTLPFKLSMAEVLGPSLVEFFVSHFWGTRFEYTGKAIRRHAQNQNSDAWQSISYWICAFSNNQYKIEEELGTTYHDSSFYLALHSGRVQATCMVLDENALPLTRSWCLFEVLQTMELEKTQQGFKGLRFCTDTGVVNRGQATIEVAINIGKKLAQLSLRDAEASRESDKEMINKLVIQMCGSFEQIDGKIREKILSSLKDSKVFLDEDFKNLFESLRKGSTACQKPETTIDGNPSSVGGAENVIAVPSRAAQDIQCSLEAV